MTNYVVVAPSIDKGQAGSKTVRTNRTAFWQIRCRGEPPPVFTWWHPVHGELTTSNQDFTVRTDEYQGGAITTLVIHHAKMEDNGTYQLQAENRYVHRQLHCCHNNIVTEMARRRLILT